MSAPPWPDPDAAIDLYARLTAGDDPLASADFAAALLDPLLTYLRATFPHVDDHVRLTAAEDAVLAVIGRPAAYDPARGELGAYLRLAARGDVLNALKREQRHQKRRVPEDCVELDPAGGNSSPDDDLPSFDDPDLAAVLADLTDAERRLFDLVRAGEKRTPVLADALGIGDRPFAEQQREVWRVRERIVKRLQRARGGT